MTKLIFFYAYRSPYSALASDIVLQAAQGWGDAVTVEPRQMSLDDDVVFADPTANPAKVNYIIKDVARLYGARGLSIGMPDPFDVDYGRAARPTQAAIAAGCGLAFIRHMSLLRWGEGRNITEVATVAEAAARSGWEAEAACAALDDASWDEAVAADKAATKDNGIFGVPFFIVEDDAGREPFWGQDRWPMVLDRLGV